LDIVIDDGSHISSHVIMSFSTLFPALSDGGLYVIEDLQTSYWPGWNGNRSDPNDPATTLGFLKVLLDGLHHQDQLTRTSTLPSAIERNVRAVHLYHNLAFIEKGINEEPTAPSWVRRHESDMDLIPKGSMRRTSSTRTLAIKPKL
jgi:demethylmacrocin O-methyltransferase